MRVPVTFFTYGVSALNSVKIFVNAFYVFLIYFFGFCGTRLIFLIEINIMSIIDFHDVYVVTETF